jgi:Flp pilus assembly protein protease CpaA
MTLNLTSYGAELFVHPIILIIIFVCMIADIKTKQVPHKYLLFLMILSCGIALANSIYSPVIFFVLLYPASDLPERFIQVLVIGSLALLAVLLQPELWMITLSILGLWLLWEFGAMGGADMKLIASTIFIANTPIVLIPMFLIGGIQGLIALVQKKKEIPFVVSIFFGFLFYTFTSTM